MATEPLDLPAMRDPDGAARQADRLTMAGGWSLLAIAVLHTLVFIAQPWWGVWLAGPFRTEEPPVEAFAQFWALPGSFVVIGALFGLSLVTLGRRGAQAPLYVPIALALWAALCVWIVGPSGFMLVTVPVVLLVLARIRAVRSQHRSN